MNELYPTKEEKKRRRRDFVLQTRSSLVIRVFSKCLPFLSKQKWADIGLAISIAGKFFFYQTEEEEEEEGRRKEEDRL